MCWLVSLPIHLSSFFFVHSCFFFPFETSLQGNEVLSMYVAFTLGPLWTDVLTELQRELLSRELATTKTLLQSSADDTECPGRWSLFCESDDGGEDVDSQRSLSVLYRRIAATVVGVRRKKGNLIVVLHETTHSTSSRRKQCVKFVRDLLEEEELKRASSSASSRGIRWLYFHPHVEHPSIERGVTGWLLGRYQSLLFSTPEDRPETHRLLAESLPEDMLLYGAPPRIPPAELPSLCEGWDAIAHLPVRSLSCLLSVSHSCAAKLLATTCVRAVKNGSGSASDDTGFCIVDLITPFSTSSSHTTAEAPDLVALTVRILRFVRRSKAAVCVALFRTAEESRDVGNDDIPRVRNLLQSALRAASGTLIWCEVSRKSNATCAAGGDWLNAMASASSWERCALCSFLLHSMCFLLRRRPSVVQSALKGAWSLGICDKKPTSGIDDDINTNNKSNRNVKEARGPVDSLFSVEYLLDDDDDVVTHPAVVHKGAWNLHGAVGEDGLPPLFPIEVPPAWLVQWTDDANGDETALLSTYSRSNALWSWDIQCQVAVSSSPPAPPPHHRREQSPREGEVEEEEKARQEREEVVSRPLLLQSKVLRRVSHESLAAGRRMLASASESFRFLYTLFTDGVVHCALVKGEESDTRPLAEAVMSSATVCLISSHNTSFPPSEVVEAALLFAATCVLLKRSSVVPDSVNAQQRAPAPLLASCFSATAAATSRGVVPVTESGLPLFMQPKSSVAAAKPRGRANSTRSRTASSPLARSNGAAGAAGGAVSVAESGTRRKETPFFCFSRLMRASVMSENPGVTGAGAVSKLLSERWHALSESEKAAYAAQCTEYQVSPKPKPSKRPRSSPPPSNVALPYVEIVLADSVEGEVVDQPPPPLAAPDSVEAFKEQNGEWRVDENHNWRCEWDETLSTSDDNTNNADRTTVVRDAVPVPKLKSMTFHAKAISGTLKQQVTRTSLDPEKLSDTDDEDPSGE